MDVGNSQGVAYYRGPPGGISFSVEEISADENKAEEVPADENKAKKKHRWNINDPDALSKIEAMLEKKGMFFVQQPEYMREGLAARAKHGYKHHQLSQIWQGKALLFIRRSQNCFEKFKAIKESLNDVLGSISNQVALDLMECYSVRISHFVACAEKLQVKLENLRLYIPEVEQDNLDGMDPAKADGCEEYCQELSEIFSSDLGGEYLALMLLLTFQEEVMSLFAPLSKKIWEQAEKSLEEFNKQSVGAKETGEWLEEFLGRILAVHEKIKQKIEKVGVHTKAGEKLQEATKQLKEILNMFGEGLNNITAILEGINEIHTRNPGAKIGLKTVEFVKHLHGGDYKEAFNEAAGLITSPKAAQPLKLAKEALWKLVQLLAMLSQKTETFHVYM